MTQTPERTAKSKRHIINRRASSTKKKLLKGHLAILFFAVAEEEAGIYGLASGGFEMTFIKNLMDRLCSVHEPFSDGIKSLINRLLLSSHLCLLSHVGSN